MARNNLAREQKASRPVHRLKYNSSIYTAHRLQRNPKTIKLSLSKYEKAILTIGSIIAVAFMLGLVGSKVTGGIYQHNIQTLTFKYDRLRNTNNGLHQRISGLENNGRLRRIASKNHLKLSDRSVRNVK